MCYLLRLLVLLFIANQLREADLLQLFKALL
jgi:hypothetical protein